MSIAPGATLRTIRETKPLVHQITNYVVMNETANATLALGALPVMAHAREEVEEMVGLASALVHHAGKAALDRGAKRLVIVADPGYHAIGIYRSLGFVDWETQVQLTRPPGSTGT